MAVFVGDKMHISFLGTCFNQRIILGTDWRARVGTAPAVTSSAEDAAAIIGFLNGGAGSFVDNYLKCLPEEYSLQNIRVQTFQPVRLAYISQDINMDGTHPGHATVANDSAAITMRTALAGRRFRGTKHIGPIPDDASEQGLLKGVYVALLNAFAENLRTEIAPAASPIRLVPSIFHRNDNTMTDISSFVIGRQSRVQRRRTVGLGE